MLRLRRLKINRYRNVKPGAELRFHDGIHVLVGKNGTGKTTLLELISAVLRSDFDKVRAEPIDIEYELEMHSSEERWTVAGHMKTQELTARATPILHGRQRWRPRLEVEIRVGERIYIFQEEGDRARLTREGAEHPFEEISDQGSFGRALLHALIVVSLDVYDREPHWPILYIDTADNSLAIVRFDESLERFHEIGATTVALTFSSPESVVRLDGWDEMVEETARYVSSYTLPLSLYKLVTERIEKKPGSSTLMFTHDELPFLCKAVPLLGCKSATLELSLLETNVDDYGFEMRNFGHLRFLFTRSDGRSIVGHEALSYGQKRLLALLYYLDVNPTHIIADELVNGLHHEWLELIMGELKGRQAFLSSQNPLLFDYLTFSSPEDVSRSFIMCELDDDQRMVWHNMAEEDAASFYAGYEVGIQHVGEILRTKGLW